MLRVAVAGTFAGRESTNAAVAGEL